MHFPDLLRPEQVNRHGARRGTNALHITDKVASIRSERRAGCTVVIAKAIIVSALARLFLFHLQ